MEEGLEHSYYLVYGVINANEYDEDLIGIGL